MYLSPSPYVCLNNRLLLYYICCILALCALGAFSKWTENTRARVTRHARADVGQRVAKNREIDDIYMYISMTMMRLHHRQRLIYFYDYRDVQIRLSVWFILFDLTCLFRFDRYLSYTRLRNVFHQKCFCSLSAWAGHRREWNSSQTTSWRRLGTNCQRERPS